LGLRSNGGKTAPGVCEDRTFGTYQAPDRALASGSSTPLAESGAVEATVATQRRTESTNRPNESKHRAPLPGARSNSSLPLSKIFPRPRAPMGDVVFIPAHIRTAEERV